jgi:hypothetical protein
MSRKVQWPEVSESMCEMNVVVCSAEVITDLQPFQFTWPNHESVNNVIEATVGLIGCFIQVSLPESPLKRRWISHVMAVNLC